MGKNSGELSLSELKEKECQLLRVLTTYCEKSGLTYYLCNGTLLGAVKYKGFIPWDDDVDVCLLRSDYDKLIKEFEDNDECTLYEYSRDSRFLYPFAKLSLNNTLLMEENVNNGVDLGVNIDIFPMDYIGSSYSRAKVTTIFMRFMTALLQQSKSKTGKKSNVKILAWLIRHIGQCLSSDFIIKAIKRRATRYRGKTNSQYIACLVWPAYKEKEIVSSDTFASTLKKEFEGSFYSVPVGYHQYLTNLYGDYRKDPPPEKQKSHHAIHAYQR